jgi:hypothetical protein
MRGLAATVLAVVLVGLALPARAQVPTCGGTDTTLAASALEDGDRAADRAAAALRRRHASEAERAWTEALAAYDRACAAGADEALERRAIPLFRLGRAVDAAESVDAFLAAHPLAELEAGLARRVTANLRAIERAVATVVVRARPEDAEVRVDGAPRGAGDVRVRVASETSVTIEASAEGHVPFRLVSTFAAGATHTVDATLARREAESPVPLLAPVAPAAVQAPALLRPVEVRGRERPKDTGLVVAGVVVGAVGVATALTALPFLLSSEQIGTSFLDDTTTAGHIAAGLFLGAGALALTSIGLFIGYATSGGEEPVQALACGLTGRGAACVGRF